MKTLVLCVCIVLVASVATPVNGAASATTAPVDGGRTAAIDSEPNDDFDTATPIEANADTPGTLSPGDVDVYSLPVVAGTPITVDVNTITVRGAYAVVVYGPDREQIGFAFSGGPTLDLTTEARATGTHYVQVVSVSGEDRVYVLRVGTVPAVEPPISDDGDDDVSESTFIPAGESVTSAIDTPADPDWYSFDQDGSDYTFRVTRPPGAEGTLGLAFALGYGVDGSLVTSAVFPIPPEGWSATGRLPDPGRHFIVLTSLDRDTGPYTISIEPAPEISGERQLFEVAVPDGGEEVDVASDAPTGYVLYLPAATDLPTGDRAAVVAALKAHAEETQAPVLAALEERADLRVVNTLWLSNAIVVEVVEPGLTAQILQFVPGVEQVVENRRVDLFSLGVHAPAVVQADERVSTRSVTSPFDQPVVTHGSPVVGQVDVASESTYGVEDVRAPEVWERFDTRGEGVTVAVLDTGVDPTHPDITLYTEDPEDPTFPGGWADFDPAGRIVEGSVPGDIQGHGTHVSATVLGGSSGGVNVGVAPGARLIHGRLTSERAIPFAAILAGMQWAIAEDADVVSMSLGSSTFDAPFVREVAAAEAAGVVVVAASGNTGPGVTGSPGNVFGVVSVGAVGPRGQVVPWSNGDVVDTDSDWGDVAPDDWPDQYVVPLVSAPGGTIASAYNTGGGYVVNSGTSMAAPHVSGVVALVIAAAAAEGRTLTPEEVREALTATANDPNETPEPDIRYGYGVVDALAAAEYVTEAGDDESGDGDRDEDAERDDRRSALGNDGAHGVIR